MSSKLAKEAFLGCAVSGGLGGAATACSAVSECLLQGSNTVRWMQGCLAQFWLPSRLLLLLFSAPGWAPAGWERAVCCRRLH